MTTMPKAQLYFGVPAFISYPRLTPARRRQALRRLKRILARLQRRGIPEIGELLERALTATQRAYQVRRRWRRQQLGTMHAPDAREVDRVLDAAVTALHAILDQTMKAFPEGSPKHIAAKELLETFYPNGLVAVVQATYVEEQAAVDDIVTLARGEDGEWIEEVVLLGLEDNLTRIAELNDEYDAVITNPADVLAFEQVRAASEESYELTLAVIASIIATFPTSGAEDLEMRQLLLGPFVNQRREAALHRERRTGGFVLDEEFEELDEEPPVDAADPAGSAGSTTGSAAGGTAGSTTGSTAGADTQTPGDGPKTDEAPKG